MTEASPLPPLRGLVLLGTDTGVGKTTVARALLRHAHRRGMYWVPFKPVETGCGTGLPLDASSLLEAASIAGLNLPDVCPYPLSAPLAPSIAARLEARTLDLDDLAARARHLATRGDPLLLEGAGGILTPWGPRFHAATLARRLGLTVVLIAANRLGVINHTALAAAACRENQLDCIGFILVDVSPEPTPDRPFNAAEIAAVTGLRSLGTLRHAPAADADTLAQHAARDLDLGTIMRAAGF